MADVVAVDLGGTNIRAARVDPNGNVQARGKIPTNANAGMADVVARLSELVNSVRGPDTKAVGVGTPGVPDPKTGRMTLPAVNIPGSEEFPLSGTIAEKTGLQVASDNDGNLAALGESWLGAGQGEPIVLIFTLGTGIGGGVVINGEVYHGHRNLVAEFGHVSIQFDGRPCGCGGKGCVERYASASALGRDAQAALVEGSPMAQKSTLLKMCGGTSGIEKVDAKMVCDALRAGDELATFLFDRCCMWLSVGIGGLMNAFNPSCVIIGGGMAAAGDLLIPRLERELGSGRAFGPIWTGCKLRIGTLGDDAGLLGAGRLAFQKIQ